MKNNRLVFVPLLFALLFAILFVVANPYRAHGQMTIPTRTPVPDDGGGDKYLRIRVLVDEGAWEKKCSSFKDFFVFKFQIL